MRQKIKIKEEKKCCEGKFKKGREEIQGEMTQIFERDMCVPE